MGDSMEREKRCVREVKAAIRDNDAHKPMKVRVSV